MSSNSTRNSNFARHLKETMAKAEEAMVERVVEVTVEKVEVVIMEVTLAMEEIVTRNDLIPTVAVVTALVVTEATAIHLLLQHQAVTR